MGGYGSTRWGWRRKATTVEDCHPLPIGVALRSGGVIAWQVDGHETDRLSLTLRRNGDGALVAAALHYTIILDGERDECRYDIAIVTRTTAAGIVQRLWHCPLMQRHEPCGRTVRTLYCRPALAPSAAGTAIGWCTARRKRTTRMPTGACTCCWPRQTSSPVAAFIMINHDNKAPRAPFTEIFAWQCDRDR